MGNGRQLRLENFTIYSSAHSRVRGAFLKSIATSLHFPNVRYPRLGKQPHCAQADRNGDGRIDCQEFCEMMVSTGSQHGPRTDFHLSTSRSMRPSRSAAKVVEECKKCNANCFPKDGEGKKKGGGC